MVEWLATSPRTGLVLDDMQVVSVKVAVALCADAAVAPGDLGPMAEHRVPLGPGMNALSGRLRLLGMPSGCRGSAAPSAGLRLAARDGERVDGPLPGDRDRPGARRAVGGHTGRLVVRLSPAERGLLRAACERLLGLLDERVLDLTDERTHAVRLGIEEVLAGLRQPQPAPAPSAGGLEPAGTLRPARLADTLRPARLADTLRPAGPADTLRPAGSAAPGEPDKPARRSVRALMPSSILRSTRNSTGGVSSPLLIRLHGGSE